MPGAHVIVDHPDFYALFGFLNQEFLQLITDMATFNDVIIEVNVLSGLANIFKQGLKGILTVGEEPYLIAGKNGMGVVSTKQLNETLAVIRVQSRIQFLIQVCRIVFDAADTFFGDDFLFPVTLSEKNIQKQSQIG